MDKQWTSRSSPPAGAVRAGDSLRAHYQRDRLMSKMEYGEAARVRRATADRRSPPPTTTAAGHSTAPANRPDVEQLRTFVKLAPNAPERPEVEAIPKTVRGRYRKNKRQIQPQNTNAKNQTNTLLERLADQKKIYSRLARLPDSRGGQVHS